MGAQNFNFAPKFDQNGGFSEPNFVCLEESFPAGRKFTSRQKYRGRAIDPPVMAPLHLV